jgi:hypothetical protein
MPHEDMPGDNVMTKELFTALAFAGMVVLNGILLYDNKEADEQLRQLQRDVGYLKVEVQENDMEISELFNIFINDPLHETGDGF